MYLEVERESLVNRQSRPTNERVRMIKSLSKFYNDSGELVVSYDPGQEELYRQAANELWNAATYRDLKHHSNELRKVRNEIQREYRKKGLILDLFHLCKGIHKGEGNFCAMVLKHFLEANGFKVLVSEEDYYLMWERGNHNKNKGLDVINQIFGTDKINKLLDKTGQGGDPDVFAFLDHDPTKAWFIEAKRQGEKFTESQKENFPHIEELLSPVEIARIVPLSRESQETATKTPKEKNKKQNRKSIRYKIVKSNGYNERPTAFKYYLLNHRLGEDLAIEALSQEAMDSMINWLTDSREQMEQLSGSLKIPLPRKVKVQFEDEIIEVNLNPERNVD